MLEFYGCTTGLRSLEWIRKVCYKAKLLARYLKILMISHNIKLSLIKTRKSEVCCGVGIHIKVYVGWELVAEERACAAWEWLFWPLNARFLCRHVNCRLIIVSSCRRLQPAAIKTQFEAVIKNDIKFNLQLWHVFGLTVIETIVAIMSVFGIDFKIIFFFYKRIFKFSVQIN